MKRLPWRNIQLITLTLCGLISLPSFVRAHPPDVRGAPEKRFEKLIEGIDLDQKTLIEIKKILNASQAKHKELFGQLRAAHKHMRCLLKQQNPDEAAVMTQADAIGALETEARKQRLRTMLQVQALLTAEQRTRLLERLRTQRPHSQRGSRGRGEGRREPRPPTD